MYSENAIQTMYIDKARLTLHICYTHVHISSSAYREQQQEYTVELYVFRKNVHDFVFFQAYFVQHTTGRGHTIILQETRLV